MKHGDITKDIIGAAMAVLNELKPGLDEKPRRRPRITRMTRIIKRRSVKAVTQQERIAPF
jgi:hypothetical protein